MATKKTAPRFRVSDLNAMLDLAIAQMDVADMAAAAEAITAIGDRYSARNRLMMWIQRPDVRHVGGKIAWRDRGRRIRKGEKGLAFLAPNTRKARDDSHDGDGQAAEGAQQRVVTGVHVSYVWDISQTVPIEGCEDCETEAGQECLPFCPATLGVNEAPGETGDEVTAEDVAELVEQIQEEAQQAAARRTGTSAEDTRGTGRAQTEDGPVLAVL